MIALIEAIFFLFTKLILGVFELLSILISGITLNNSQSKYNARFMSFWERIRLLRRSFQGINCSGKLRLSPDSSTEGIAVLGASGSGKSSVIGITNALQLNNSFLIIDVDGNAWNKTAGAAVKRGFEVKRINLIDPAFSEQIELLRQCKDESDINRFAETLMYSQFPRNGSGESQFWEAGGISVLKIVLSIVKTQNIEFQNLSNARHLLQRLHLSEHFISQFATPKVWNEYLAFSSADEKVKAGFIQTALMSLNVFSDPALAHITSTNTLNFEEFTTKKQAWYIQVSESKLPYYENFLNLFFSSFFEFLQTNPPKKPVYLLLDEVGHLKIKNFPTILTTMRKYKVSVTIMLQDIMQLQANYGKEGMSTILSGACAHKIIFPGISVEYSRILSEAFGRTSFGEKRDKHGYISDSKELLTVRQIIQGNKKNYGLYLFRNKSPYLMKMTPYFKQWRFKRLTRIKPPFSKSKPIQSPALIPLNNQPLSL